MANKRILRLQLTKIANEFFAKNITMKGYEHVVELTETGDIFECTVTLYNPEDMSETMEFKANLTASIHPSDVANALTGILVDAVNWYQDLPTIPKPNREFYELHLDLETTTFNKIDPATMKHGAKEGDILEVGAILMRVLPMGRRVEVDRRHFFIKGEDGTCSYANTKFHQSNNYLKLYGNSKHMRLPQAEKEIITMLEKGVSNLRYYATRKGDVVRLAGKSCSFDLDFLQQKMPKLSLFLSHELYDMSAFKNSARTVMPKFSTYTDEVTHVAIEDCEQTVRIANDISAFWSILLKMTDTDNLQEMTKRLEQYHDKSVKTEKELTALKNQLATEMAA